MTPAPYVLPTNTTDTFMGMMRWANNTVEGMMGWGIILIVLSVVFLGTKRFGATTPHALVASTLTAAFITAPLTIAGVTGMKELVIISMLMMFSYIYAYHS